MTIKIDPGAMSHIGNTCREAVYAAVWALREQEKLADLDGHNVRLCPRYPMREKGEARPPNAKPSSYTFLEGCSAPVEEDARFWRQMREKFGDGGIPSVAEVWVGDARRTAYFDVAIEGASDRTVSFKFNDAVVTLPALTDYPKAAYDEPDPAWIDQMAGELHAQWDATMKANRDAYWTPERKAKAAREQKEREEKDRRRREQTEAARAAFPFKPKAGTEAEYAEGLGKNSDPYGGRCYSYASDWASLMEQALANGSTVEACAKETSRMADYDGITGFMYGASVSILAHFWKHGDALRRWHNLDTQIGNEGEKANESGGVLNPALMSVS